MPARSFVADRSSLLAVTGSTELGGGQDDHLPIGGPWNGYTFRGVVRFVLDWSSVKKINSATLILRTSSAVHVGFSSAPDIYVARATSSWSPNSASSSSEGGSGWSTSPVVYPGPSSTSTGRATKRMPTSEGTSVSIDITAIVRAWAPTSVAGGGAAANYGILLYGVASGDVTEVNSYTNSSGKPSITLDYATDTPPTAVATGPTGTTTSKRPPLSGTAVDPDGDAITAVLVEVRQGSTVVYSQNMTVGAGLAADGTYYATPSADLPSGALTSRCRPTAAGVQGAYSADLPFVIDRLPTVTGWTAPAATVTGTRRPVHTFTWTDADGDPGEVYDVEVYQDAGGGAFGALVASAVGLTASASPVSWTPTVDLPGGALVARSRIRTRGVYSAWSANRAYTVVLTVPTLTWAWPEYDGGWARVRTNELADPGYALSALGIQSFSIDYRPPSGTTIDATKTTIKTEVEDPGVGGPAVGTVLASGTIGAPSAGAAYTNTFRPNAYAPAWVSGTIKCTVTIVAANGGQTVEIRRARFALGEWTGAVALGDQVSGLTAATTAKIDDWVAHYRAQSSPTAAAPSTEPADLLGGSGSFETIPLAGWTPHGGTWSAGGSSYKVDGANVLIGVGNGTANPYCSAATVAVRPGSTYTLTAGAGRAAGNAAINGRVSLAVYDALGVGITTVAVVLDYTANAVVGATPIKSGAYTMPANAALAIISATMVGTPNTGDVWIFDAVKLVPDALASWRSVGVLATVLAEMPATNAYLGVRDRLSRRTEDSQMVVNPSFENGTAPWGPNYTPGPPWVVVADATAPDGGKVLQITGDGVVGYPSVLQSILVANLVPGATYKVSGWAICAGTGSNPATMSLRARNAAGAAVGADVAVLTSTATVWTYGEGWYTVPTDGSIAQLQTYVGIGGGVPPATRSVRFDRIWLQGPIPGDGGIDRLDLAWSSLG